jgi:hypothetical protein
LVSFLFKKWCEGLIGMMHGWIRGWEDFPPELRHLGNSVLSCGSVKSVGPFIPLRPLKK